MPNSSSSSTAFSLFDLAGNLNADNEFRNAEAKTAYLVQNVRQDPCVTKITRMTDWIAASFSEPWTSWLYFSASDALEGWIKFGTRNPVPMSKYLRQIEDANTDKPPPRYFTGLNGREYRWEHGSRQLLCYNSAGTLLAKYEYLSDDVSFARLDIMSGAETMVTEILTTLLLNRHAIRRTK